METKKGWLVLNIVLPLLPLVFIGVIKVLMWHVDFDLINASSIWFFLALLSLIISNDLKLRDVPLDNSDKKRERYDKALTFKVFFVVFLFCCPISEAFHILVVDENSRYKIGYYIMTISSYITAICFIRFACRTQGEFNLTAKPI